MNTALCGRTLAALPLLVLCGCLVWTEGAREPGVREVGSLDLSGATCGIGKKVRANLSVDGHPLTIAGKVYASGFGACPESAVGFVSNGKVTAFDALVGVDDEAKTVTRSGRTARVIFKVWADGKIVWTSKTMSNGMKPQAVHVDLAGVREIVLETSSDSPWLAYEACNADWVEARFTFGKGATLEPVVDAAAVAQLGILTPPAKDAPQINGADIWGVRPGRPVLFRVATSGVRPMRFSAVGLPPGVTLDAEKGILGGVAPTVKGDFDIMVTAENAKGRDTRVIRLSVGDTIALTPPMGWNSWNTLCYRLTADKAKAAARAMEESGLGDHGWSYVNLDDWWEMNNSKSPRVAMREKDFGGREDVKGPARDAAGRILPNRSFPDMKDLTDYIHSFGFKAGLYSSPGRVTCGQCEGSLGHEAEDAASWAEWGFDYVKYDWCSYGEVFRKETGWETWEWQNGGRLQDPKSLSKPAPPREAFVRPYRLMADCLKAQKRDIVYSYCQYGIGDSHLWAAENGANCWRTWHDLKDTWPWMEKALEGHVGAGEYHKYNRPGCWADPDMMIVGQQYSFGFDHPSYLTPNEQYTHVSLWCMIGSPLLIGCDLTTMDAFTKNLLMNDEVIAVSQDRLGRTARRVRHTDAESVWTRPLADGSTAVAIVNRYPFAREITVPFAEVGVGGEQVVRDLWRQCDEGKRSGEYVVTVPPHATKLVRLVAVPCAKCE